MFKVSLGSAQVIIAPPRQGRRLFSDQGQRTGTDLYSVLRDPPGTWNLISVGSTATDTQTHYDNLRQEKPRGFGLALESCDDDENNSAPEQDPLGLQGNPVR